MRPVEFASPCPSAISSLSEYEWHTPLTDGPIGDSAPQEMLPSRYDPPSPTCRQSDWPWPRSTSTETRCRFRGEESCPVASAEASRDRSASASFRNLAHSQSPVASETV